MPTKVFQASKDATAVWDDAVLNTSYGAGVDYHLYFGETDGYYARSFVQFTTNFTNVASIESAVLTLTSSRNSDGTVAGYVRDAHGTFHTANLRADRVTESWNAGSYGGDEGFNGSNSLEWTTMPAVTITGQGSATTPSSRPGSPTALNIDITSIVRAWAPSATVASGGDAANYGIRLKANEEAFGTVDNAYYEFYSMEGGASSISGATGPYITVTYTEPAVEVLVPTVTIGLPNGTSASGLGTIANLSDANAWTPDTALAQTTLSWTAAPSVGRTMKSWQLQIYTSAALTGTPVFDTDVVDDSAHVLDTSYTLTPNALKPSWVPGSGWLTASGYDGLPSGVQYYHKVTVVDTGDFTANASGTFKLRWGQSIYEFDSGVGTTSGWAVDYDPPAVGTQIGAVYQASGYRSQAKITNMSGNGATVTVTCADGHSFIVGDVINITAASPATYNLSAQTVLATGLTATAFTVSNALAASPAYAAGTVAYASLISYEADQTAGAYVKPAVASITAVTSTTTLITYTASNTFVAGQRVTVTGCSTAAHNVSNALISTRSGSQFTVVITGGTVATSTTGRATMHGRRGLNAPITGVTANGTSITYSSPTHTFLAGQVIDISGITPSGFNLTGATISSVVAATSFTIASTVTGTYTRGGNATPKVFSSLGEVEGHNRYLVAHIRTSVNNASSTKPVVKNLSFSYLSGLQLPDNWASETGTNYYLDANTRRFGTKAAKVEVTLAPDGFIYPDRGVTPSDISVVANTTYSFSTYVKYDAPTGANNVRLRVYPAGTIYPASATILADSGPHTDFPADTEGWRRLSVTFRTGGSTTYVRPMIYMVNTAGSLIDFFWVDGVLFEEGTVVRSWTPGFVTSGMTFEGGGMNIDSSAGGVLRLRGSDGGPRDEVTTGTNGLNFGGATSAVQVYSGSASTLDISGNTSTAGTISATGSISSATSIISQATGTSAISIPNATASGVAVNTGITIGGDTNLYRSAANVLKTDDKLVVVGDVEAAFVTSGNTFYDMASGYHNFATFTGTTSVPISITVSSSKTGAATEADFTIILTQFSSVPGTTGVSWFTVPANFNASGDLTGFTLYAFRSAGGGLGVSWMVGAR